MSPLLGFGTKFSAFTQNQTSYSVCRAQCKMKAWVPCPNFKHFRTAIGEHQTKHKTLLSTNAVWLHRWHAQEVGVTHYLDAGLWTPTKKGLVPLEGKSLVQVGI